MKAPLVFGSLLALAGTAITAERADASILDGEIVDDELKSAICGQDWYQAVELSSRLIISPKISPEYRQTLLEWRNHFYRYAKENAKTGEGPTCEQAKATPSGFVEQKVPAGPMPRFSPPLPVSVAAAEQKTCEPSATASGALSDRTSVGYSFLTDSFIGVNFVADELMAEESDCSADTADAPTANETYSPQLSSTPLKNLWTVGVRVDGNNIKGRVLNNGWNTFQNVNLILRSRRLGNSTNMKTVAIGTVRAWSETEFVAAFADGSSDWIVERIEVN